MRHACAAERMDESTCATRRARVIGMTSNRMGIKVAGVETDIGSGVEVRATPAPACQVMDQRGRWPSTWLTIDPTRHHKRRPLLAAKGRSHLTASGDAADLKVREDSI